jgi:type VI secretion system secreted protein VgrG
MESEHTPLPTVEYAVRIEPRNRDATGAEVYEEGDLLVRAVALDEFLDGLYQLKLTVLADVGIVDVDPEALLEADVSLHITRGDYERRVHGVVARVEFTGFREDAAVLRFIVVPAVDLLSRWKRSRIFQDLSVVDIVVDIIRENLLPYSRDVETKLLARTHEVRDYCVQYRETDLVFVQRILAEEGIFMLFDHSDEARERVVLVDTTSSFAPIGCELLEQDAGSREPPYVPVITDRAETADTESVIAFEGIREVTTRAFEVRGWDWKSSVPSHPGASEALETELPGWVGEIYEHGDRRLIEQDRGSGDHRDDSPALAKRRLAGLIAGGTHSRGGGLVTSFSVGHTFTLDGHPHTALDDQTYVLTMVRHHGDCPEVERGGSGDSARYFNSFECAPLELRQVPAERPKPRVRGYQTATVVGPPGQEIHTDDLGRIKVLMHWDREQRDGAPDTTCWLRVAQMLAGNGWGTFFLPRVGMEVLVAFLDGDPDRPIVTGCVYNGAHAPPYALPEERTKSTIKTSSSPGGQGYNELRFEDAKDAEEVFIHAQRDMNTKVKRNKSASVGSDERLTVGNDRTVSVSGNERHSVKKDRIRQVNGTEQVTIDGSQKVTIGGAPTMGEASAPTIPGAETHVEGTMKLSARDQIVLEVGGVSVVLTPMAIKIEAPTAITLGVPNAEMALVPGVATTKAGVSELALGPNAMLKSETRVRAQCGTSHLTADPVVVRVKGTTAVVDGTSMAVLQSTGSTSLSGATVTMNAKANVTISSIGTITASCAGSQQTFMGGMINLD